MKEKLKNRGLWVAVISLVGLLMGNYGLYEPLNLTPEVYEEIAYAVLSIFVLLGIVSDADKGKGFKDNDNAN